MMVDLSLRLRTRRACLLCHLSAVCSRFVCGSILKVKLKVRPRDCRNWVPNTGDSVDGCSNSLLICCCMQQSGVLYGWHGALLPSSLRAITFFYRFSCGCYSKESRSACALYCRWIAHCCWCCGLLLFVEINAFGQPTPICTCCCRAQVLSHVCDLPREIHIDRFRGHPCIPPLSHSRGKNGAGWTSTI